MALLSKPFELRTITSHQHVDSGRVTAGGLEAQQINRHHARLITQQRLVIICRGDSILSTEASLNDLILITPPIRYTRLLFVASDCFPNRCRSMLLSMLHNETVRRRSLMLKTQWLIMDSFQTGLRFLAVFHNTSEVKDGKELNKWYTEKADTIRLSLKLPEFNRAFEFFLLRTHSLFPHAKVCIVDMRLVQRATLNTSELSADDLRVTCSHDHT